jgi:hypothetical protein
VEAEAVTSTLPVAGAALKEMNAGFRVKPDACAKMDGLAKERKSNNPDFLFNIR